jgi:5-(carboxyamino)imidazole ribonucleotide synthase
MFAIAARRLGYRVHVFSPQADSPAGQVADVEFQADYLDLDAVARFARETDVVTLEFENVPLETLNAAARHALVRPGHEVLQTAQDRIREKKFLQRAGLPVARFQAITSLEELQAVEDELVPGVLKTATDGYDGKGQYMVRDRADLITAWQTLGTARAVLEELVDFNCELSVVSARTENGRFQAFPPIRNCHRNHILDISVSPSGLGERLEKEAMEIAREVMEQLQAVGVLCVEFFLRSDGQLLVNEIAPRPHNSGHLTIDAHSTCQFEQQVRAVCGLPLGSTRQRQAAAMVNLLGDCWQSGEPAWDQCLDFPDLRLHLYGKAEPRPGRKMGHLVALADSAEQAVLQGVAARRLLRQEMKAGRSLRQPLTQPEAHREFSNQQSAAIK